MVYQTVMKMKIVMNILMAYDDDNFWDDLEEDDLHEEISELKICLEEKNMIIDTLTYQLAE